MQDGAAFRFTLFNGLALLILFLTLGMAIVRMKARPQATWPLGFYAVLAAFALAFPYSLNLWLVGVGAGLALMERFTPRPRPARIAEYGVLAYVFTRSLGLLLNW